VGLTSTARLNNIFDPESRLYELSYEFSVFDLDQNTGWKSLIEFQMKVLFCPETPQW
jgi:hypothetical protein